MNRSETEIKIPYIGFVKNNLKALKKKVHTGAKKSKIILRAEYIEGLYRIEESEFIEVIFHFHKSKRYSLTVETPHWGTRGVFASRSPRRPAPLGLTRVKLLSVNKNELIVEGLDAVDGTPVVDIKPTISEKENKNHGKT